MALRGGLSAGSLVTEASVERARAAAHRILETHEVAPLPSEVSDEIAEIIRAYAARG
jgi:hypothetical protein